MKELIVNTWCDACAEHGIQEAASTTPPITIGGAKARTLDLCEVHRKDALDALQALLKERGTVVGADHPAPAKAPAKLGRPVLNRPGPYVCRVPGCEPTRATELDGGYANLGSFRGHVKTRHGLKLGDYRAQYGDPSTPGDSTAEDDLHLELDVPDQAPGTVEDYICGVGGCQVSYDPARYARPAQALGAHRATKHGVRGAKHGSPTPVAT